MIFRACLLLAAASAAIHADASRLQDGWKGSVTKDGEVTVISNPGQPVHSSPVLELREDLRIGGPGSDGEPVFNKVRGLVVDDNGDIYALDWGDSLIKVFDASGRYLRTISRPGQGPGELDRPFTISFNRTAGELAVLQISRRISYFRPDGKFLRQTQLGEIFALLGRVDSQGNIFVEEAVLDRENPRTETKKLDPNAKPIATLGVSPSSRLGKSNPMRPVGWWLVDDGDNLVYGHPERYEIRVFGAGENREVRRITREYDPVPVTGEEKERWREMAPPEANLEFSDYHAAYRSFFLSDEGHIIVQTWEKAGENLYMNDIFDRDGRFIGRIPLKPGGVEIRRGEYYAVEEDEEGYQVVKRCAVKWVVK
jgi:hypothetical protein